MPGRHAEGRHPLPGDGLRRLRTHARMFVAATPDLVGSVHDLHQGASFRQAEDRLVHAYPAVLRRTTGEEVRLRLPRGYTRPGPDDGETGISVSQWLDDDHIAIFADDGGGDLPAKEGDVLVCRLSEGSCRVAVPRSSGSYVVPFRPSE